MSITNNFNGESFQQFIIDFLQRLLKGNLWGKDEESSAEPADTQSDNNGLNSENLLTAFTGALESFLGKSNISIPGLTAEESAPEETPDRNAFDFTQESPAPIPVAETTTELSAPHTTAVFWGDSIAHGMGQSVRPGTFAQTVNMGVPGAGFLTSTPPQPPQNIPENAAAFIYFGTNDIGSLIGQSDEQINAYARRVIEIAEQMKAQGADPVILGLNAPKGAYTGGSAVWSQEGFVDSWVETMNRVNEAYKTQAEAAGITYASTDAQITSSHISSDNLHLTNDGNRELINIGMQSIGN